MDWQELNCVNSGLELLIDKYEKQLTSTLLDDNKRAELSNDKLYAEILLSTYEQKKKEFTCKD